MQFILICLWLITVVESETGSVSRLLTVRTGGSLIIPCYYDKAYAEYKKYWCFDSTASYSSCSILAYANETKGRVSVIDHPDQSFFTVTMRNLQHEDTGAYWCAVEIGGIFVKDSTEQLQIEVQSAPDVSVVSSSVSGHEGGDISVQCFYSSGYQNKVKQWCRYKDQSCYTVGRTNTSQNSSVQISDDGRKSFTVLMTGLRLTDSGWYYCSVGDLQAPVQLLVQRDNESKTESDDAGQFPSTCKNQTASKDSEDSKCSPNDPSDQMDWIFLLLYTAVPLLLLLMLVLVIWRLVQKHNGALTKRGPDICSVAEGQKAVTYDTVVFKKANKHEPNQVSISHSPEQFEVIYSTLNLHQ